jgi:FkbH-like protein
VRFTDSLKILRAHDSPSQSFRILLACGSTPIHLQSFLGAHVQQRMAERRVVVTTGPYGDCIGTLSRSTLTEFDGCAIALEWSDLDPRLGFRRLGGWGPNATSDIVAGARGEVQRLVELLQAVPAHVPVALSLPTLRPAPAFFQSGWEAGAAELALGRCLADLTARVGDRGNIRIVNRHALDARSLPSERFDLKTEAIAGIAYRQHHADVLGEALGRLIYPGPAKKGLITDLDGTLWQGIVGDVGAEAVSWDLDHHALLHGLYQQLLQALSEEGVLVGVASRNNVAVVDEAFARADILLQRDFVFPLEVHWNRKSDSVSRILEAWNVNADSVVFVDDSPMELEEVGSAHPGITCLQFPADYADGLALLYQLRDMFGRSHLSDEDALRRESLRSAVRFRDASNHAPPVDGGLSNTESLLAQARAVITFDFRDAHRSPRSLELVNKTNQFNLNGRRYSESEWHELVSDPRRFVISASYEDKFGRLGTIAVVGGERSSDVARVDVWVMSCRAFARRVEHQVIAMLFDRLCVDELVFDVAVTARNEPLQQFLGTLLRTELVAPARLSRAHFEQSCPALYHTVTAHE